MEQLEIIILVVQILSTLLVTLLTLMANSARNRMENIDGRLRQVEIKLAKLCGALHTDLQ